MVGVGRGTLRSAVAVAAVLVIALGAPGMAGRAQAATGSHPARPAASRPASAGPTSTTGGAYRHGTVPTVASVTAHAKPRDLTSPFNVTYHGGDDGIGVITGAPQVYLVFWGSQWGTQSTNDESYPAFSGDPAGMAPDLEAFIAGLGTNGDSWSAVTTQYCQDVPVGTQACPSYGPHVGYPSGGALAGVWEDNSAPAPAQATAHALAVEAVTAADHFGNTTQASNRDAQYFVVSPGSADPDYFNAGADYCAWHDQSADPNLAGGGAAGGAITVAFTNLPYLPDATYACGQNFVNSGSAGTLDGVSIIAGSEYADTVTDQFPGYGWLLSEAELDYECAWIQPGSGQGSAQDITLATGTFAVSSLWSNDFKGGTGGCETSHPVVVDDPTPVAPIITSPDAATSVVDIPGNFTVDAIGLPVPAISVSSPLPAGITFTDNHDRTATLAGAAQPGEAGTYPLTVVATNGVGAGASQSFTLTVLARGGIIVNFAGQAGIEDHTGDGGPATAATIGSPDAIAVDSSGDVYISDATFDQVRKVDPSGTITTVAGSPDGQPGDAGDGGPATAASLDGPAALAVDNAGNLYIADAGNHQVRRIDRAGNITDFAGTGTSGSDGNGGPATAATLTTPSGLAVDAQGDVYIADADANQVREVNRAGIISTVAGSAQGMWGNDGDYGPATAALLSDPQGLAVDQAGNLYIADSYNNRIRVVNAAGVIDNFAGSPAGAAAGDGDGNGDGDGGPAGAAIFSRPLGVATDANGDVFVTDYGHDRVRKVDPTGTVTNFAGNVDSVTGNSGDDGPATAATLYIPTGIATDQAGDVFLADVLNNRVREVFSDGPSVTSAAAATLTVGVAGSFAVAGSGFPHPQISESGALPTGVSFNGTTDTLGGIPAQGTAGTYAITLVATNSTGPPATQNFTLTVDQATLTYPTNGQVNVATTQPFTWATITQARGYLLTVGSGIYGTNLVNSGPLPSTQ